ncbi:MAG: aspartate aminotransferase family protein [Saprospiraceae bacterium]|nr:aspartate aminotransferase family protein [Saprospiraceae bacterium]
MLTNRQIFYEHLAQTTDSPIGIEIEKAEGIFLYDTDGKRYYDLISGISVSNIGHRHPKVIEAINSQLEKYLHLMVYGEYIMSPQVKFAKLLTDNLPETLNSVYLVNSGSEAIEGALKLAKRYNGRSEIIAFINAYHGSTHGALSVMGNEEFKNSFRPLVPGVNFLEFNNFDDIEKINSKTACVLIEPIQAEAGIILPKPHYLHKIKEKCKETGTLLIFDEVQTGFGRTGKLFCFEDSVVPDIIVFAKGIAGGMPLGAFVASKQIMSVFTNNPILGHITTFGGHPVSCAAAIASFNVILSEKLYKNVESKAKIYKDIIGKHPLIKEIRSKGLMMAFEIENFNLILKLIDKAKQKGVIIDWFLFADNAFRLAPPLIITDKEAKESANILFECLNEIQ